MLSGSWYQLSARGIGPGKGGFGAAGAGIAPRDTPRRERRAPRRWTGLISSSSPACC
ncbi:hypothetical protein GS506_17110 [Rhodococcus hoagii]|nr:hypothetical protein [Prescottella equi]